jgi:hypothetical protein
MPARCFSRRDEPAGAGAKASPRTAAKGIAKTKKGSHRARAAPAALFHRRPNIAHRAPGSGRMTPC